MSEKLAQYLAINSATPVGSANGFTIARGEGGLHSVWRETTASCVATGLTLAQAYSVTR
jgi:hypothetical protein